MRRPASKDADVSLQDVDGQVRLVEKYLTMGFFLEPEYPAGSFHPRDTDQTKRIRKVPKYGAEQSQAAAKVVQTIYRLLMLRHPGPEFRRSNRTGTLSDTAMDGKIYRDRCQVREQANYPSRRSNSV